MTTRRSFIQGLTAALAGSQVGTVQGKQTPACHHEAIDLIIRTTGVLEIRYVGQGQVLTPRVELITHQSGSPVVCEICGGRYRTPETQKREVANSMYGLPKVMYGVDVLREGGIFLVPVTSTDTVLIDGVVHPLGGLDSNLRFNTYFVSGVRP